MENTEFRWLVVQGAPVAGAIKFGGMESNLWQVLQFRQVERVQPTDYGDVDIWGEWRNMPVSFAPPPAA